MHGAGLTSQSHTRGDIGQERLVISRPAPPPEPQQPFDMKGNKVESLENAAQGCKLQKNKSQPLSVSVCTLSI